MDLKSEDFALKPEDVELTGYFIDLGSKVTPDATWERINWLVDSKLEKLSEKSSGFEALYRDPGDGRLWEKTHVASHMQDGGPPRLRVITPEEANERYGVSISD